MDYSNQIIEFCISNRVSTTEVADALGKSGVLPKILPINLNYHRVGRIRTVFAANNSNYSVHEQIRDVQKGEVVIIFTHNCGDRAIIGDLISKYVLLYKGAAAVVVQGLVRDAARLRREGYAVWSEGVSPLGCFNVPAEPFPNNLRKEIVESFEGGIAVCDDGGITVITRDLLDEAMLKRLQRIEMQEDIWFYCLDTLKWDTKKIVCDKAYLTEQNLLSRVHIEQMAELTKPLDLNQTPEK
jgi:4-hydroxy-4-methyl-2-oxoglutarate aldolase